MLGNWEVNKRERILTAKRSFYAVMHFFEIRTAPNRAVCNIRWPMSHVIKENRNGKCSNPVFQRLMGMKKHTGVQR